SPGASSLASSDARARCSELFTDATLVSSSSATSLACQRSASRRISTARCCGGRCWSAATNASLSVSCSSATCAGSPSPDTTCPSGIGSSQLASPLVVSGLSTPLGSPSSSGRIPRSSGSAEPGGRIPASLAVRHGEPALLGDPKEPGFPPPPPLEPVEATPGAPHRPLHRVLGVEGGAEHPVAVARQLPPVAFELA